MIPKMFHEFLGCFLAANLCFEIKDHMSGMAWNKHAMFVWCWILVRLSYQTASDHKWQSMAKHSASSASKINNFWRNAWNLSDGGQYTPNIAMNINKYLHWSDDDEQSWLLRWHRFVLHMPGWLNQRLVQRSLAQRFDTLAAAMLILLQKYFEILLFWFVWYNWITLAENYSTVWKWERKTPETKKMAWRPRACGLLTFKSSRWK